MPDPAAPNPAARVPTLAQCKAFIFDMDGTLTVPQHDFDAIRDALDIPAGALILEHLDALPDDVQREKRTLLNSIEAEIAEASAPAPGVFQLLDELRSQDIGIAILTRNTASNAWISLNRIGAARYFTQRTVVGRDEAPPKPDPAGIHLLAQRLGYSSAKCAMVGDYRHDLEAGAAAGAHTVHLRHPKTHAWPEITSTTVSTLQELLALC